MYLRFSLFIFIVLSTLSGCKNSYPLIATPKTITQNDELKLSKLSQQIHDESINKDTKILLLFERATLYDAIGFKQFAKKDFELILKLNAKIPDVYNYLGMYAMAENNYKNTLFAFNMALELDPSYQNAYFYRAIALYRTNKYHLALTDIKKYLNFDKNDPIRILWTYLIEEKINKNKALNELNKKFSKLSNKSSIGYDIIAFYIGNIKESQLLLNLQSYAYTDYQLAVHLCETYFYLGKYYQSKGDNHRAEMFFKLALTGNLYNYFEHQQAHFELIKLNKN